MAAPGGKGQGEATICYKGKTITVAEPALKKHLKRNDTKRKCATMSSTEEVPETTA